MVAAALIIIVLIYCIFTYNSLVVVVNNVQKSWANIDVLLKQRHDELPKLIDTCKVYMMHEQTTLEKVIQARAGVNVAREAHDIAALNQNETLLQGSLSGLFALAENYPDLKANINFTNLQNRITGLENAIADRREFYNDSVNVNNVRVQQFPDLVVAKLFGFGRQQLLKFAHEELADVDVSDRFKA